MISILTHVNSQLPEIGVELTRETQASRDTRHDDRHEVVKITVRGRGELECAEANVVKRLVVNAECLVGVLDQLVNRKGRVVRLSGVVFS